MVEDKVRRIMFHYPSDMSLGDKRNITMKSGYLASASLRSNHTVVYQNLIRKYALEGVKNTTNHAMRELNKRYPERYQELRTQFQEEMVKTWKSPETPVETIEVSGIKSEEYPEVRKSSGGFFSRLFRRGL